MIVADRIDVLMASCATDLGAADRWYRPEEYHGSLALCIIDAIQSTRSHYTSVQNVIRRYNEYRAGQDVSAYDDSANDLIGTFDELGGAECWADRIGNRKPTSTAANAPLKSAAILAAARVAVEVGFDTAAQLRGADDAALERAAGEWNAIPGQRSGLTWSYAVMLSGARGYERDPLVTRYVARALGVPENDVTATDIALLVGDVAQRAGHDPSEFGHSIWRFESRRPVARELPAEPST